jgi:serine protease inhibitor ecotin
VNHHRRSARLALAAIAVLIFALMPGSVYAAAPTQLAIISVNGGTNPVAGVAFDIVVEAQDGTNAAAPVVANTTFSLSLASGTGPLLGTASGQINATFSQVTVTGITYNKAESGVSVVATNTGGDVLTAGTSATFTVDPGNVSATSSTVTAAPPSVVADGATTSLVTVTLLDSLSNPVPGKTVSLAHSSGPGSPTIGAASGLSDPSGVVTFTVKSTTAATDVFTATDVTDSSLAITQTATVDFTVGPVSAAVSTVVPSPGSVVADGVTTSTITVTLRDGHSNPVSGNTVTLAQTSGPGSPIIGAASGPSNGSGVVTFTVKSTTVGTDVFSATDVTDSLLITETASVTFTAGSVSASTSTVVPSPASVPADGATTSLITVTLLDALSNPVSGKTVSLARTSGPGSPTIGAPGTSNSSGVVTFTVKSTTAGTDVFTATDTTDPVVITQTASVTFTVGGVSAATSTVVPSPGSVPADGVTTSLITVTLLDSLSNPVAGKTVSLAKTSGPGSPTIGAPGVSNGSGVVTFTVKSTTAGTDVFTATDTTDTVVIAATASVTFTVGGVSASSSTVARSPTSVVADGVAVSTITVTLLDSHSNPVPGKVVTLAHTSGAGTPTISVASGPSDAFGVVTFTVKSTTAATDVFAATDTTDTVVITATASVVFAPGPTAKFTVTGGPATVVAGTTFSVTVTAQDAVGNTTPGYLGTVHFTSTDAYSILPAAYPFVGGDAGVHVFSVKLRTVGPQTVTTTDTVTASTGTSAAIVVTATSGTFHPLTPVRFFDTRNNTGTTGGALLVNTPRQFQVTGSLGVPANATAVTGNLTVTQQQGYGYLFIGPNAQANPTSSTLNFPTGEDRANSVTVALSGGGTLWITYVSIIPGALTHAIFDVSGYFTPDTSGVKYFPITPVRILDSRPGGVGSLSTFHSNVAQTFTVAGLNGVPSGATAVTGNLTVTQQTQFGYLFAGPVAENNPTTSNLNFPLGDNRANQVTVALGSGTLSITYVGLSLSGTAEAIFDLTGYFMTSSGGSKFTPLTPARILDTRISAGGSGPFSQNSAQNFAVVGSGGVPTGATAVTGNLTITDQQSYGFLYLGPSNASNPTSSTLNFPLGDNRANAVAVGLTSGGGLYVTYNAAFPPATTDAIFDVSGYFAP